MPADILVGGGNSPLRHLRQIVVAEKGTTLKLRSCRSWIIATSGKASKVVDGIARAMMRPFEIQ
jgi:hypothetical protein